MHKWSGLKQKICPSCPHYQPEQESCALLANDATPTAIPELLNGKPCDPERFLRAYITRYITAKYGPEFLEMADGLVEDALRQVRTLARRPLFQGVEVSDLGSFREWLLSFARDLLVRSFERTFAGPACGICDHYSRTQPAVCRLQHASDGNGGTQPHPWYTQKLPSDQDPQALDPPCDQFVSLLFDAYQRATAPPKRKDSNLYPLRNPFDGLRPEELEPMIHSLLERLERRSLRLEYIIRKVFFSGADPDAVARELGTQGWIVRRELEQSLEVLHQLLTQNKLDAQSRTT